ncbi:MAG TPA: hypothetical protein VIW71_03645 [Streptomyces sp.]
MWHVAALFSVHTGVRADAIKESPRPLVTGITTEVEPSPVFVDRTGRRGRRLRGLGWVVGVVCVGFALAMISGLLGTQSQAPRFAVPDTADTAPPGQYVNAPLPSPPLEARRSTGEPGRAGPRRIPNATTQPTTAGTASAAVPDSAP